MKPIRLFLVDDHQIMIDGLKALLADVVKVEIAGFANNGKEALKLISPTNVDCLITDISMPEMTGKELAQEIKLKFPGIKIIALSMFNDHSAIHDMIKAGASGYILKNTGQQELITAIEKVMAGETYFSSEASAELARHIANINNKPEEPRLTTREIEIIKLIAQEYSNEKIASELFISERTVETHRKNIFRKTKAKSIVGLMKYAYDQGIV